MADMPDVTGALLRGAQVVDMIPGLNPAMQAQIELTRAQTQGAQAEAQARQLANQRTALLMRLYAQRFNSPANGPGSPASVQRALSAEETSGVNPGGAGGDTDADTNQDGSANPNARPDLTQYGAHPLATAAIDQHVRARYQVLQTPTPQEMEDLRFGSNVMPLDNGEFMKAAQARYQLRLQAQTTAAQRAASQEYDDMYAVATAPEGSALNTMKGLADPDAQRAAAMIERHAGEGGHDSEQMARDFAATYANRLHAYTGRSFSVGKDGIARDSETNQPVPGGKPEGLSAEQKGAIISKADAVVEIPQSDGTTRKLPEWQYALEQRGLPIGRDPDHARAAYIHDQIVTAEGAQSPLAQHAAAIQAGTGGGSPAIPQGAGGAAQLPWLRQPQGVGPAAPAPTGPATAAPGPTSPPLSPQERAAYSDPDYKVPAPTVRAGVSQSPAAAEEQKQIVTARTDLLKEQSGNSLAAGQALRYYTLARDIINSGGVTTGWGAPQITKAKLVLQQLGVDPNRLGANDPAKTLELVKDLTNAGLQNLKTTYGARVTQSEVFLNLEHANPNVEQSLPAMRRLINDQVDNLAYSVDSAKRANRYLAAGNDPRKFDSWNQQYYPRQVEAVAPQPGPRGGGGNAPVRVASPQEAARLPAGTTFVTPDGRTLVKR